MVDIADIPDFPGQPGQTPEPGAAPSVSPVAVVLVAAPLDRDYISAPVNSTAVDAFIAAELAAGRGYSTTVERWAPWSPLQLELGISAASEYNYARFIVDGRSWYAFLSAQYLNLTSSVFTVVADWWATYPFTVGYSMVTRGHVAVAASQSDEYGSQYLTAPEPIEAPPIRGVIAADILPETPDDYKVLVISANDLRGGTGFPFWDTHVEADLIAGAANLASSATITAEAVVQQHFDDANYPWNANPGGGTLGGLTDTISPGHTVTNPGGTIPLGWQWHIDNEGHRGGVDWDYNFQTFTAPAAGTVDHFDVAGVGMVVRLTLDTPAVRTSPQLSYDQFGPIVAIWFEHCSAAVDGHANEGDVIGTSGDGYGAYPPHLHVHASIDNSTVSGSTNRSNMWGFIGTGSPGALPRVLVPKVEASPVSTIDGVSAGGGAYLFTLEGFAEYMTIMQGAPWVTSGISDTRLVPSWALSGGGAAAFAAAIPSHDPADPMWNVAAAIPQFVDKVVSATSAFSVLNGWRESALSAVDAGIYRKILTAQFTEILVGNGSAMERYTPDQWLTPALDFVATTGAAHGEQSIRLAPFDYNLLGDQMGVETPFGGQAGLAHAGYGLAAAATAASDISPYLGAFSAYSTWIGNQKNRELAITLGLTNIGLNAGVQAVTAGLGAPAAAVGGALSGGGAGARSGAISSGLGMAANLATAQMQASNTIQLLDVSQNGSFDIGAFQLGLSGQVSLVTFNTWVQSLNSASGHGVAHKLASAWRTILGQGFKAIISMPSDERIKAAISEWRRYGYMVGQAFAPTRLDVMTHWSYWQIEDPVILGNIPSDARAAISAAFARGVTVWGSVSEIGTQPDNQPVAGVTY